MVTIPLFAADCHKLDVFESFIVQLCSVLFQVLYSQTKNIFELHTFPSSHHSFALKSVSKLKHLANLARSMINMTDDSEQWCSSLSSSCERASQKTVLQRAWNTAILSPQSEDFLFFILGRGFLFSSFGPKRSVHVSFLILQPFPKTINKNWSGQWLWCIFRIYIGFVLFEGNPAILNYFPWVFVLM